MDLLQQGSEKEIKSKSTHLTRPLTPETAGLIKWQLKSDDYLQDFERFLLGYVFTVVDDNGKAKYVLSQEGKQWCNVKGANSIASLPKMYLTKEFTLTNYDEAAINRIMKGISMEIIFYIGYWQQEFDIDDGDMSMLANMLINIIEANLRRAKDMKTFDAFTTTFKTFEEFGKKDAAKKGFLARFASGLKITK